LNNNIDGMQRLVEATVTHDAAQHLGSITAPTFVIHADGDLLTGTRLTTPLADAIPQAESVLIENLPHVVAGREHKKMFSDAIGEFLNRVESN
jgi:pimeloyl-ACP methyl ester carboxylesterase